MEAIISFISENLVVSTVLLVAALVLIGFLLRHGNGKIERTSNWTFNFGERRRKEFLKTLAGEWRGTFQILEGSRKNDPVHAEYTLVMAENFNRSPSGILLYDAHDPLSNQRIYAGADMLLPCEEDSSSIAAITKWHPTFKRCVHWQAPPRSHEVEEIDKRSEHTYKWDVKFNLTKQKAQMHVTIRAQKTNNVFEGILEKI